ncbi:MAG: Asp-tRNA(Asn)/Glu-tRNA(Gln) amidotransferase subunit GatC [Planctomycetota bacterium]|nr:Asp-tRNA(Asn)/Glu-tRNA(Gln) amidotransferase subunit GatC [Planctomycetota bacterium]MEC8338390.1 Asp-tRNA(Asn)/Glu-tRNA(Gln) amidotransferase subunit GatC [Planctomycetota bacterium]
MVLTRADVEKIASLARLRITADEADCFASQLADVLRYVETLEEINTDGVEPMAHPIEQVNVLADDVSQDSFPRETMLRNAPKCDEEYYRVPPVLGD